MFSDPSTPIYVAAGAAFFGALAYIPWPKIELQVERQSRNGIDVLDFMLSFSSRRQQTNADIRSPNFEFSVYVVCKRKK